jgi:hypothetical protein
VRTVRRISAEAAAETVDNAAERARRDVGRPSKAEAYREILRNRLSEDPDPAVGGIAASRAPRGLHERQERDHASAQRLRVRVVTPLVRFEGSPGEFSHHDFGEAVV